jgi:hypothetical protein
MSWLDKFKGDEEVPEEKQDELLKQIAKIIDRFGLEIPGTFLLYFLRPFSRVTTSVGRFFFPWTFLVGGDIFDESYRVLTTFENRDNWTKLINIIEEEVEKEQKERREKRRAKLKEKGQQKKSWRSYLPF